MHAKYSFVNNSRKFMLAKNSILKNSWKFMLVKIMFCPFTKVYVRESVCSRKFLLAKVSWLKVVNDLTISISKIFPCALMPSSKGRQYHVYPHPSPWPVSASGVVFDWLLLPVKNNNNLTYVFHISSITITCILTNYYNHLHILVTTYYLISQSKLYIAQMYWSRWRGCVTPFPCVRLSTFSTGLCCIFT